MTIQQLRTAIETARTDFITRAEKTVSFQAKRQRHAPDAGAGAGLRDL